MGVFASQPQNLLLQLRHRFLHARDAVQELVELSSRSHVLREALEPVPAASAGILPLLAWTIGLQPSTLSCFLKSRNKCGSSNSETTQRWMKLVLSFCSSSNSFATSSLSRSLIVMWSARFCKTSRWSQHLIKPYSSSVLQIGRPNKKVAAFRNVFAPFFNILKLWTIPQAPEASEWCQTLRCWAPTNSTSCGPGPARRRWWRSETSAPGVGPRR